jgi:hypothetical protein
MEKLTVFLQNIYGLELFTFEKHFLGMHSFLLLSLIVDANADILEAPTH